MKKVCILAVLLCAANFIYAQGFTLLSKNLSPKQNIEFTFNPKGTNLDNSKDLVCNILVLYTKADPLLVKVDLQKEGPLYKGEFLTNDSVSVMAVQFSSNDLKEENPKGNVIVLKRPDGKQDPITLIKLASLYGTYGQYIGMKPDFKQAQALYAQAFKINPALKYEHFMEYANVSKKVDSVQAKTLMKAELNQLNKMKLNTEKQLSLQLLLSEQVADKKTAEALRKALSEKFPAAEINFEKEFYALYDLPKVADKEQKALALIEKYQLHKNSAQNSKKLNLIYSTLAQLYEKEGDVEKFQKYTDLIPEMLRKANIYNSFAWNKALKKQDVPLATKISKMSLDILEAAKKLPVPTGFYNEKHYKIAINMYQEQFADTYALLLYYGGDYKGALAYQEQALDVKKIDEDTDTGVAERYVTYLEKNKDYERTFNMAEQLIKKDKATDSVKTIFKNMFRQLDKKEDFNQYMANLEMQAQKALRASWAAKMVKESAPSFNLTNLKGEKVDLSALKGSIVILDYWATWCGPCIKSFPGMQLAVNKYADNPKVKFLFINTWQREAEADRDKKVREFINQNKYNFNVLFDTRDANDPNRYQVVEKYKVEGIPAKFIIDKDGNIRFKTTGSSGGPETVLKEINTMVELLLSEN